MEADELREFEELEKRYLHFSEDEHESFVDAEENLDDVFAREVHDPVLKSWGTFK